MLTTPLSKSDLPRTRQLALHWKAPKVSPSPPDGGEGWGEEAHSACVWPARQQLDAPLPSPLPARSSWGEGVGPVVHPVVLSVLPLQRTKIGTARITLEGRALKRHKCREPSRRGPLRRFFLDTESLFLLIESIEIRVRVRAWILNF